MKLPADPETMVEEDLPLIRDADTKLHNHPDATLVCYAIADFYTTPEKNRAMTWEEFLTALEEDLSEPLPLDPTDSYDRDYVTTWCRKYIAGSWGLMPKDMKHKLIQVQDELKGPLDHHEMMMELRDEIDSEELSPDEKRKMADTVSKLAKRRDEELERWQVIPDKSQKMEVETKRTDVSVDASLDHLKTGGQAVDVDGGVKDSEE